MQWLHRIVPTTVKRALVRTFLFPLVRNHPDTLVCAGKPGSANPWWHALERTERRPIFPALDQAAHDACIEIYDAYRPILSEYGIDREQFFLGSIKHDDAAVLYQLVRQRQPRLSYQIGTFAGYSALLIAHALRRNGAGRLIAVDPEIPHRTLINPVDVARRVAHELALTEYIQFVRGWHALPSVEYISPALKRTIPIIGLETLKKAESQIDFAFIDADHSTSCTIADFWLLKDFLARGSVTAFHDVYAWPTVAQAIYLILNDIYYYTQGTRAYFAVDIWRGVDGLAAFERMADERYPTTRITVVDDTTRLPISGVRVQLQAITFEALTGNEGMVYVLTEVPADARIDVTHPNYQPCQTSIPKEMPGDFTEVSVRLQRKPDVDPA